MSPELEGSLRHLFKDAGAYDKLATNWRVRLSREAKAPDERVELMHQANPAVIPRNHRIEQAIEAALDQEDYGPFEKLLEVLSPPYEELEGLREYICCIRNQKNMFYRHFAEPKNTSNIEINIFSSINIHIGFINL